MPFVTKNLSYYFTPLSEQTTEALHVGLYLAGSVTAERHEDFIALGRSIRTSNRSIRCLWLRFKDGDDTLLNAFRAFGTELVGTTAIQSIVFEGRVNTNVVECLSDYFFSQNDLRGIQFRRTDADASTFHMLRPFFVESSTLKVIDTSMNPGVGDECINVVLDALLEGEDTKLETLNIGENNLDGEEDDSLRVSGDCVASIASFVSKTPSLSSITLKLRHLDDIGIGELANVMKRPDCKVRRLELSGNYGNSGVKIFAEALKTNVSLRTMTFGCLKTLNDVGGQVLLDVVDPFSQASSAISESMEWDNVMRSNHTLQSIYILDRPTVTMNKNIINKLQSISTMDSHPTLQAKCWQHVEKNIEDISHMKLETKHMPEVLSFVQQHGTMDHLYRMIKSRNTPDLFSYPSPEKARLSIQMEKVESENEVLKSKLHVERKRVDELHKENTYLRNLFRNREEAQKCCLLPFVKLWNLFLELLRDPPPVSGLG